MPSRALNGRDPQQGKKEFSRTRGLTGGFTIIELMVVIAVVAIITSFALPSYRTLIEKRQVTSGAEQLGAFLSAVQRNDNITVSYNYTDEADWCVGITTGTSACDCTDNIPACTIDGQTRIFNTNNIKHPEALAAISDGEDSGMFVFDPVRGLVFSNSNLTTYNSGEFGFLSDNGTYALNVQVSATGRVKYCSDADGTKVPGYDVCAN